MDLLKLDLDCLTEFDGNPRTISSARVAMLRESLTTFGLYSPLVVQPDPAGDGARWRVLAGNQRLAALRMLRAEGVEVGPVPCVVFGGDEVEARLLLVRDNAHDGEWDWAALHGYLASYGGDDVAALASLSGFDATTIDDLLALSLLSAPAAHAPTVGADPLLVGTDPRSGSTSDPVLDQGGRAPTDPAFTPTPAPPATTRFALGSIRGRVPLLVHGDLLTAFERIATETGQTDIGTILSRAIDVLEADGATP